PRSECRRITLDSARSGWAFITCHGNCTARRRGVRPARCLMRRASGYPRLPHFCISRGARTRSPGLRKLFSRYSRLKGVKVANSNNTMPMRKRGRPKTLEFTPTKRKNYAQRKNNALIDWTDSSKQAHVLDWRHRAQEFGLAVEIRDELEDAGQAYAPS